MRERQGRGDKSEHYFRIDRDLDLTVDVGIETPEHRKARGAAMRKRSEDGRMRR